MGAPIRPKVPTACRGEPSRLAQCNSNAHKPLTLGPAVPPSSPSAKRGLAADPVSSSVEDSETKRGAIPPFRRSEGSARYPPRAAGVVTWAGENTVCGLGRVQVGERRRGRSGRLAVVRQDACWLAVGWALAQYTTVEKSNSRRMFKKPAGRV
ncbi:hypothetical protein LA080_010519 [Diaporthe eres]|nr:hypothetical protein LA080_010519 [Diaporthe eres]